MNIKNYVVSGLTTLVLAGSIFLSGCLVSQPPQLPQPQRLEQRIKQEQVVQNNERDKYAVLISGAVAKRDMYDLSMAYQVFLENGFKRENIYILDQDGVKTPIYPVDDLSSKQAIDMLFTHLSRKVDENDLLFVYITDHGERTIYKPANNEKAEEIEVSAIVLPGPDLNEIELREILDKVKSRETIVLADFCYGGGFANRFSNGRYVGISSSTEEEKAHGDVKHTFGRYLMEAHRNISESDRNGDGTVNISEAFEYAKQKHPWTRDGRDTPVIKSKLDLEALTLK